MEMELIAKLAIAIVLVIVVVSLIFGIVERASDNVSGGDDFMRLGKVFSEQSELCEKYNNEIIDKDDFRAIMASIAYSDCRTLNATLGFSMTAEEFERMIDDIFPEGKTPQVIYKAKCKPYETTSGSFIVVGSNGKYIYTKDDNINITSVRGLKRDVIICQR